MAARQPGGARAARHFLREVVPERGCLVQVVGRRALGPCPVLGEEGTAPRRAGTWPTRARRAMPVIGRQRRGVGSGSELLDAEATQTLHSRVGWCCRMARALQVVVDLGAALVTRRLLM
jgi:hypothetical protein